MTRFIFNLYSNLRKIDKRKRLFASVFGIVCAFLILTLFPFSKVIFALPILFIFVYFGTFIAILEIYIILNG